MVPFLFFTAVEEFKNEVGLDPVDNELLKSIINQFVLSSKTSLLACTFCTIFCLKLYGFMVIYFLQNGRFLQFLL